MMYYNFSNTSPVFKYTKKPSKYYFHIPEIKKIDNEEQLKPEVLSTLYTEIPVISNLYDYIKNTKERYYPLPLCSTLLIKKLTKIPTFNLTNYTYYMYETKKEKTHFIGGDSVLFDSNYNLLFLVTAKALKIPYKYLCRYSSPIDYRFCDYNNSIYFIFSDTTINVSNKLIKEASNSKVYNNILMKLLSQAATQNWKFIIDKDLHKKWIATPTAPDLKDIKVPLNSYIQEELKEIIDSISTYA